MEAINQLKRLILKRTLFRDLDLNSIRIGNWKLFKKKKKLIKITKDYNNNLEILIEILKW